MTLRNLVLGGSILGMLAAAPAWADESSATLQEALVEDAKVGLDLRYRLETVDDDAFAQNANASTLRTLLNYKSGKFADFTLNLQIENVTYLGQDEFNSTVNGVTNRPVIADPDGTEVNHAYLAYTGIDKTTILAGRTPHNIDNQRFVGTVGWRQNSQSYDSVALVNKGVEDLTLTYAYVWNVNRIFGDDHPFGDLDTNTHVFNASYGGLPFGKLTGYAYLIDLNDAPVFGLSSQTFGASLTGKTELSEGMKLLYRAEYATQSDYADNPVNYNADYYALEGGVGFSGLTAKVGYEVLGSDNNGTASFKTPLATLHKFNGWADKFLATPGTGLADLYASLAWKPGKDSALKGTRFVVAYHDFSSDTGGLDHGKEWDLLVAKNFAKNYSIALKFADYNADSFSTDTQKIWVQLGAKF